MPTLDLSVFGTQHSLQIPRGGIEIRRGRSHPPLHSDLREAHCLETTHQTCLSSLTRYAEKQFGSRSERIESEEPKYRTQ